MFKLHVYVNINVVYYVQIHTMLGYSYIACCHAIKYNFISMYIQPFTKLKNISSKNLSNFKKIEMGKIPQGWYTFLFLLYCITRSYNEFTQFPL